MDGPASVFQSDLSLNAKLDKARTELLDLSARNRLLNIPRFSKTAKTIEIVDERSTEIFRLLVRENKPFTFTSGREKVGVEGESLPDEEDTLAELPQPDENEAVDDRGVASRHADTKLQTRLRSKGLQKRLLDLYNDARTLEEEQGVNILYLALGTLKWVDPLNATNIRHAPLILAPVRLERGSAGERFKLRARQEDYSSNLSLEAYLDRVHALKLPVFEAGEDFDPQGYMAAIAEAVEIKKDWEVRPDDIILGFFSFAKFLMYRDLDPETWPAGSKITAQPLILSLLADGFAPSGDLVPEFARIDDHIQPADMLHIVDCDSSQSLAVHDVRSGRNLVIQGPPGTGKSQTIANVIASAVADGKTVLFVAEKMAALDVVKRRLDQAGVGDACLELHSNKVSKRAVLDELRRTWELGAPRGDFPTGLTRRLTEARDILNAHTDRMHRLHAAAQLSPYQVFGHLARLRQDGRRPVDFEIDGPARWSHEDRAVREDLLSELARRVEDIGRPEDHPWRGIGLEVVIPTAVDRLMTRLIELKSHLILRLDEQSKLARTIEAKAPQSLADVPDLVTLAQRIASAPDLEAASLSGEAWESRAKDVVRLLDVGSECEQLTTRLAGLVAEHGLDAQVEVTISVLTALPSTFDAAAFNRVSTLTTLLPRILAEADTLAAELGVAGGEHTLASIGRMATTAERVAAAPHASPEAFAATVWDHGVEQAGDLAQAVATLEAARREIGGHVTDPAWTTDVAASRQALATHTGMLRKLNGDWRRAMALIRTVLREPDAPLPKVLSRLDALMKGQAASRAVLEGDAFGRAAFGADWRGEKSASEPLIALVDWMRTLRGLGAEPRLIAGRLPERSLLGERAVAVRRLAETAAPLLAGL